MTTENAMQLGMVGLGRMGSNIVRRLMARRAHLRGLRRERRRGVRAGGRRRRRRDHHRRISSRSSSSRARSGSWCPPVRSPTRRSPRWPSTSTRATSSSTAATRYYRDDIRRADALREKGIHHVDCGTSGGVWGMDRGYCLMIGGEHDVVQHLAPIFQSIAPGVDSAPRTPGRTGEPDPGRAGLPALRPQRRGALREDGAQRHRVRADGRLRRGPQHHQERRCGQAPARVGRRDEPRWSIRSTTSTTSTPPRSPRCGGAAAWSVRGCSTSRPRRSTSRPTLEEFAGRVSDSGEGRWTSTAAIDEGVPAPVLTAALYARFASRGEDLFADKVLSAMRKQFGGHDEKPAS